jgi:hypothetical protein
MAGRGKGAAVTKEITTSFRRHPVRLALGALIDVAGLAVIVAWLAGLL